MTTKSIHLDPATHARLLAYRARLELSVQTAPRKYPQWMQGRRVSLADAIVRLLDDKEDHLERSAKSQARRKDRADNGQAPDGMPWDQDETIGIPPEHLRPAGEAQPSHG